MARAHVLHLSRRGKTGNGQRKKKRISIVLKGAGKSKRRLGVNQLKQELNAASRKGAGRWGGLRFPEKKSAGTSTREKTGGVLRRTKQRPERGGTLSYLRREERNATDSPSKKW